MFPSGFRPKIYKTVKGVPIGNRSWRFLAETVSSKCLSTMLGIRSQRLQTAGMGRLDMRYRCFGAVPLFRVMGKILIPLLLVMGTIIWNILFGTAWCGHLRLRREHLWSTCDWTVSSCNCTLIKGVCFQTSCLAVSYHFLEHKYWLFLTSGPPSANLTVRFQRAARMAQSGKKSDSPAKMTVSFVRGPHDDDEGHMVSYKDVLGDSCFFTPKEWITHPNFRYPSLPYRSRIRLWRTRGWSCWWRPARNYRYGPGTKTTRNG